MAQYTAGVLVGMCIFSSLAILAADSNQNRKTEKTKSNRHAAPDVKVTLGLGLSKYFRGL